MCSLASTLRSAMSALEEETSAPTRPSTTSEMKLKVQVIKLSRGQVELKHQVAVLSKEKKRLEARIHSLLKVVASHGAERDQLQLQLDEQAAETTRQVAALQEAVMVEHSRMTNTFERETTLLKEQLAEAKKFQEEALKPSSIAMASFEPSSAAYTPSLPTMTKSPTSKVAVTRCAAVQMPDLKLQDSAPTTPPSRKRSASSIDCASPQQERRVRRKPSVQWTIDFLAL